MWCPSITKRFIFLSFIFLFWGWAERDSDCASHSFSNAHTHTHRRCPSARAGNSSDDPPVCFRNNLPLRLRHRAVALIQMNHFTNLFPPLTRRQSFLSFPPVLFSIFAGPSHCIFSLCFPLLFFDLCYAVDGDEFPSCGFQMLFCFHWLKNDALFASQCFSQSGES